MIRQDAPGALTLAGPLNDASESQETDERGLATPEDSAKVGEQGPIDAENIPRSLQAESNGLRPAYLLGEDIGAMQMTPPSVTQQSTLPNEAFLQPDFTDPYWDPFSNHPWCSVTQFQFPDMRFEDSLAQPKSSKN
ncbi:hypothetical protein LTR78_003807 [Recurvomyces mirabilis]|uniref:Uncharacterized protein n=1 Tax=Recurvomyces mirabilis TaxID=574656 RepID=A0AAE0WRE8_9PEZI|nr:hypothetical protein LTR78_003807 [Recurvomyces mirabilis]KAK5154919.1 hypothetical protein LTS14_006500 [Recurvomyces mirabilis]